MLCPPLPLPALLPVLLPLLLELTRAMPLTQDSPPGAQGRVSQGGSYESVVATVETFLLVANTETDSGLLN